MRIALPLLLSLLASTGAYAQTPQIDRIDVVEYGIYTTTTENKVSAPGTASGTRAIVTDIRHAATTRTVSAQKGVDFGFRYTVVGAPAGAVVPIRFVTIFPAPGLRNPDTQQLKARSEYDFNVAIGQTSFKSYGLDNDWKVVPGIWTMQIWYQGRKLAEQSFTVVKQ